MRNHARTAKCSTTAEMALTMDMTPYSEEFEEVKRLLHKYPLKEGQVLFSLGLIFNLGYVKGKQDERARKKAVRSGNF